MENAIVKNVRGAGYSFVSVVSHLYVAGPCYTAANEYFHSLTTIDSVKSLLSLQGRLKGNNSCCVYSMVSRRA